MNFECILVIYMSKITVRYVLIQWWLSWICICRVAHKNCFTFSNLAKDFWFTFAKLDLPSPNSLRTQNCLTRLFSLYRLLLLSSTWSMSQGLTTTYIWWLRSVHSFERRRREQKSTLWENYIHICSTGIWILPKIYLRQFGVGVSVHLRQMDFPFAKWIFPSLLAKCEGLCAPLHL